MADQIIVINIEKGYSKVKTKALLDEFLLNALKKAVTSTVTKGRSFQ